MTTTLLRAFGPLRFAPAIERGQLVAFVFRGEPFTGVVETIGKPFNGVQGIHTYAQVRFDDSTAVCAQMLDELEPIADQLPDGMLW